MCSFGSCQTRFEFLSQFRKVRNAFECFVTKVQTHLPKTKCVWPMKINVICTVVPYPLERNDGGQIRWAWYPVYQACQSHSSSNSIYMVLPRQMVPDIPTHPLFPWGMIISSSHHVPRSCFTIWFENISCLWN